MSRAPCCGVQPCIGALAERGGVRLPLHVVDGLGVLHGHLQNKIFPGCGTPSIGNRSPLDPNMSHRFAGHIWRCLSECRRCLERNYGQHGMFQNPVMVCMGWYKTQLRRQCMPIAFCSPPFRQLTNASTASWPACSAGSKSDCALKTGVTGLRAAATSHTEGEGNRSWPVGAQSPAARAQG